MKKNSMDMCEGPLFGKIIIYSIPIIMTGILQLLFNAADLIVVGQFGGEGSVGSVGATSSLINLLVNLFIGISVGTGVTVSHAIGSHSDSDVKKAVHTAIPTAFMCGVFVSVVGFFISGPILRMMDTPENLLSLATLYTKIYFCGAIFNMIYNFGSSILRAAGDTKSPLIFLSIAGVLNVILNIFFVTVFKMDVAGVALATIISQAVSAVLVIIALTKRTDACRLQFSKMQIHKKSLMKMFAIGIPSGIQSSLFSISNVIIQSSINSFGSIAVNGSASASSIEGFLYVTLNAFYHTALNFAGQNVGAKKYPRVRKILLICLGCVAVVGIIGGITMYGFGTQLLSIYLPGNASAISFGLIRLKYICMLYCLCGFMDVATACIRAMGSSFTTLVISIIGVCGFRMAWVYTVFQLPQFHSPDVLFMSYPISWALS